MARRIVDLTRPLPQEQWDGALAVREFEREGGGHHVHHRVEMDASVGTHVIAPRRIFRWGASVGDLAPETFFGEGVVARFAARDGPGELGSTELELALGRRLQHGDIVVLARAEGSEQPLRIGVAAAQWLNLGGAKLVVIDENVQIGSDEVGGERLVLETFFESDLPVIRDVTNTSELSNERFALMALPLPVPEVDSWPVRVVALDPGARPEPQAEPAAPAAIETASAPEAPQERIKPPPETGAAEQVGAGDQAAADAPAEPAPATVVPDETTKADSATKKPAAPKTRAAGQTRAKPKSKATSKARAKSKAKAKPKAKAKSKAKAKPKAKAKAKARSKPKAKAKPKARSSKSGASGQAPDGETQTPA